MYTGVLAADNTNAAVEEFVSWDLNTWNFFCKLNRIIESLNKRKQMENRFFQTFWPHEVTLQCCHLADPLTTKKSTFFFLLMKTTCMLVIFFERTRILLFWASLTLKKTRYIFSVSLYKYIGKWARYYVVELTRDIIIWLFFFSRGISSSHALLKAKICFYRGFWH